MSQAFGGSSTAPLFTFGAHAQNQPVTNPFVTTPIPTIPFNFAPTSLASTTSTTTTSNSAPIFSFGAGAQSSNVLASSTASKPFTFGPFTQNTPIQGPFEDSSISKSSINFTTSNFTGGFAFGSNNNAPTTQPFNPFGSNSTRTQTNFTPTPAQVTSSINMTIPTPTVSNSVAARTTVNQNRWGNGTSLTPGGAGNLFQIALNGALGTQNKINATTMNATMPNNTNLIGTKTSVAPPTNSPFMPTTETKPQNVIGNINQGTSNFPNNTKPFAPFSAVFQTNIGGNVFPQTTTTLPHRSIGPTDTVTNTHNAFGVTANPMLATFTQSPMNNFTTNGATTVAQFNPNPLLTTCSSETQVKPVVTTVLSTIASQEPKKTQNIEQSMPDMIQQFLAAVLADPYSNFGKKDFSCTDLVQVSAESFPTSIVSTAVSTTTTADNNNNHNNNNNSTATTTSLATLIPLPVAPVVQTNFRKGSSLHSSVDVNFKLKPTSSSPSLSALNDIIKPSVQQSKVTMGQLKSTFTDEEELVLLGQRKTSKSSLSHVLNGSSVQSNPIHSLYPVKRLTDLENLISETPSSSSSTSTFSSSTVITKTEQNSHFSNENRGVSLNQFSPLSIVPQQQSSSIIQPKTNYNSQAFSLPILTHPCYYTKPTMKELESLYNDKSQCILSQFTVGHEKYGSVTFYGRINVAGLNLDEIIEIKRHEVTVYPDDNNKPPVGEGLNLPARITLFGVYPIDRSTHEEITDIERIKAMNYDQYLSKITEKFDGEFLSYGSHDGSWTFMVKHFTRYGLDLNQNDVVIISHMMNFNKTNLFLIQGTHRN